MLNFTSVDLFCRLGHFPSLPQLSKCFSPVTVQSVVCIVPYCGSQNATAVVKPSFPIMKQLGMFGGGHLSHRKVILSILLGIFVR